jgi:4-hydroxy-3-polyprenylbenzoate decarboxylase
MKSIAVGITGASGAIYATRTVAALLSLGLHVELVVSDYGRRLLRDELGESASLDRLKAFLAGKYGDAVTAGTSRSTTPGLRGESPAAARGARRWRSSRAR